MRKIGMALSYRMTSCRKPKEAHHVDQEDHPHHGRRFRLRIWLGRGAPYNRENPASLGKGRTPMVLWDQAQRVAKAPEFYRLLDFATE
jgi:hypothetical protein